MNIYIIIGFLNAGGRQSIMVAVTGCVGRLVMTSIDFAKMAQLTEKIVKLCRSDIECKIKKEQRE